MRGKVRRILRPRNSVGITPAYAGKRLAFLQFLFFLRDHPRICGEKVYEALTRDSTSGSPPHMRGKGQRSSADRHLGGITPAYAGKRREPEPCQRSRKDHPRICGEKSVMRYVKPYQWGSPPHMRGKGVGEGRRLSFGGITPAYAGKRRPSGPLLCLNRDHPRICGEKTKKIP